ncbi:hypothetical protein D3C71_1760710 [compost metagenome]
MVNVAAPQILRPLDPQLPGLGSADQGLAGQQVEVAPAVQLRVKTATVRPAENLRQPLGQRTVGLDFVKRRLGSGRVGNHQLFAICRGHASPCHLRSMNVAEGEQGSGQPHRQPDTGNLHPLLQQ